MSWTRRDVLKTFAAGAGALAMPARGFAAEEPDVVLRLAAAPARLAIRSGSETRGVRYTGEVLRGRRDALRAAHARRALRKRERGREPDGQGCKRR